MLKKNLKYILFVTIAALFIGLGFTLSDFIGSPFRGLTDFIELYSHWFILFIATWSLVYLLSINKYIFSVLYPIICGLSSVLAYFRYTSGTTLTTMILDAALDNDTQITLELITPLLILSFIFSILISILFVIYRFRKIKIDHTGVHLILSLSLFLIIFNIPRLKAPIADRIPFNLYYITSRYISEKKEAQTVREKLSENVSCESEDDLIVVMILGESLRSDHLGINGYERNTTPNLQKEDIISFPNIYSEYTYTNVSLQHILTRADSIHPEYAYNERSFVDLFKSCDFHTIWLANQEPAKSYVYFMKECDTLVYANTDKSGYVFENKWTDADLLPAFRTFIAEDTCKQMIIMHTIGSHWYYNAHFPDSFQIYNPIVKSRIVSASTPEELINSYDNTILCTDFFIYSVINELRNKNAIVFYLSDHGESLGENGIWLHATDSPPIHYPACFIWLSPQYKARHIDRYETLQENKSHRYRTDFLFHTILEAADIQSDVIDLNFSLFKKLNKN